MMNVLIAKCVTHLNLLLVIWWMVNLTEGYSREDLQKLYPGFGTDFVLFPDEHNNPVIGYLKIQNDSRLSITEKFDYENDVKFMFFSRELPNGTLITSKSDLKKYVNPNRPTKFVTHGWMSGGSKDTCVLIKNGFLYKYDANVFIVDWSDISGNVIYPIAMEATPRVGKFYGAFLNYLVEEIAVNPKDIHLVGHSLGAHVSGFAGREVKKGKIGRISGLDPALPGFDIGLVSSGTLKTNDADFVDVIHTCAGFLGYKSPLGHADFYPNGGGPPQPGCTLLQFLEACSHGRSWKIYASSLMTEKSFIATKCSTLRDLDKSEACHGNTTVIGDPTPTYTRGIYYSRLLAEDLVLALDDINKI